VNRRKFIKSLLGLGAACLAPFSLKAKTPITTPIEPAYVSVVGPDFYAELKDGEKPSEWVDLKDYMSEKNRRSGELGIFEGVRFYKS